MNNFRSVRAEGQAMVELTIVIGFAMTALFVALSQLSIALRERQSVFKDSQLAMSEFSVVNSSEPTDNYRLAEHLRPIITPLTRTLGVRLELKNLRQYKDVRTKLFDTWSASTHQELRDRPRSLLVTKVIDGKVIDAIQGLSLAFPWMREFRSDSLKFGWVDPDVVPINALCRGNDNERLMCGEQK